jgi:tetratricopeptide (TPR) repeat protein
MKRQRNHIFSSTLLGLIIVAGFHTSMAAENTNSESSINQCNQYNSDGSNQKALELANQLLSQNRSNRDALICKGKAELGLNKNLEAIETFKLVKKNTNSNLDKMMAGAMLGNAYKADHRFKEALDEYNGALTISKTLNNKGFERVSNELVASALVEQKKYAEAIDTLNLALKLAQNDSERANIYELIANVYEKDSKIDTAIEYQLKASIAHTKYGDLNQQANVSLELGRLYIVAHNTEKAEYYIQKVHQLAVDNGGPYWEAKSDIYLAKLRLSQDNKKEAGATLDQADKINATLQDKEINDLISLYRDQLK